MSVRPAVKRARSTTVSPYNFGGTTIIGTAESQLRSPCSFLKAFLKPTTTDYDYVYRSILRRRLFVTLFSSFRRGVYISRGNSNRGSRWISNDANNISRTGGSLVYRRTVYDLVDDSWITAVGIKRKRKYVRMQRAYIAVKRVNMFVAPNNSTGVSKKKKQNRVEIILLSRYGAYVTIYLPRTRVRFSFRTQYRTLSTGFLVG